MAALLASFFAALVAIAVPAAAATTYSYDGAPHLPLRTHESTVVAGLGSASALARADELTSGLATGSAAEASPRGFSSAEEFGQFGSQLHGGLVKAGFCDTRAAFQGSSVTGRSCHTGAPFDVGRVSDFDVAPAGEDIFDAAQGAGIGLRSGGIRTGPLGAVDLESLGLTGLRADLSDFAGRDVNFMIFRNLEDALGRGPSIGVPGP